MKKISGNLILVRYLLMSLVTGSPWNISHAGATTSSSKPESLHINCNRNGTFPITGSCKEFYHCEDLSGDGNGWHAFRFTCLPGTIFDDEVKQCRSSSITECHREETYSHAMSLADTDILIPDIIPSDGSNDLVFESISDAMPKGRNEMIFSEHSSDSSSSAASGPEESQIHRMRKRSATFVVDSGHSSGKKAVDIVAQSALQTCEDVGNIDNYIKQLCAMLPIELPSFEEEIYKNILKEYNRILEKAKSNTNSWTGNDSILEALTKTYNLTREFEPKFQQRFILLKKTVQKVMEKEKFDVERMKEERKNLMEDLMRTEKMVKESINVEVNAYIKKFFQEKLKKDRKKLNDLEQEIEKAEAETEFQELIQLLEFVRLNANEIQEETNQTIIMMEAFRDAVTQDESAFKRSHTHAEGAMKNIQEQKVNNNMDIANIVREKDSLDTHIRTAERKEAELQRKLNVAHQELVNETKRLQSRLKSSNRSRKIGLYLLIIPVFGWIAGGALAGVKASEISALLQQKEDVVTMYYKEVTLTTDRLARWNEEIASAKSRINNLEKKSQKIQEELEYFEKLNGHLEGLQDDVEVILPFIAKAIASIRRITDVFKTAENELLDVIDLANKGKTAAMQKIYRYFMFYETEKLKSNWMNAKEKIISLGECVSE